MPVPHEVTREFFIPTEDDQYFENQTAPQPIEERIGDLLFLFNLLDAAFGRTVPDDNPERPENANEAAENGEDGNEEGEMYDEETDHMTEDNMREIPVDETGNENPPDDEAQEGGENARLTRHVIRLDEFDLLALPLLLMRSRIRRNEEVPPRQQPEQSRLPSENEQNGQDDQVDPLLRLFTRAFDPNQ